MQTKPLAIGETLSWPTPDGRFVIAVQRTTAACWNVTVEQGGFRIDELARTRPTESAARDLARDIAKRLRDGATVDEVVAAIQPAADVISAAEQLLHDAVLAENVRKLSQPQRDAIRSATTGHITRSQVSTVSTLYALEAAHLGVCTRVGYRVTGLDLNGRGLQMQAHILTHQHPIAA